MKRVASCQPHDARHHQLGDGDVRVTGDGYALLDAGEPRIALLKREQVGDASARISLAFEVSDLQLVTARLAADGCDFAMAKTDAEGLREINVADPDGNRIRLFSWPKNW